jgi:tetratricopeptide (TPR) repeat protein
MAYREQMYIARSLGDNATADKAREEMFRYGQCALLLMDRDPQMQLFMVIEYLDAKRFKEARALMGPLLSSQPNSAQAHLLNANLLAEEHQLDAALKEAQHAVSLDQRYYRAYLWLARVQTAKLDQILIGKDPGHDPQALVKGGDTAGDLLITAICQSYRKAVELMNGQLDPSDRLKFATALFLAGDEEQGIAVGQQLQRKPELTTLCQRVSYFCEIRHIPIEAQRVIAQLNRPISISTPPKADHDTPSSYGMEALGALPFR